MDVGALLYYYFYLVSAVVITSEYFILFVESLLSETAFFDLVQQNKWNDNK